MPGGGETLNGSEPRWRCRGRGGGASERQQSGGVEQQGVELLGVNGSMQRRLRAAALDFRQQVLNLFDCYQDLHEEEMEHNYFCYFLKRENDKNFLFSLPQRRDK